MITPDLHERKRQLIADISKSLIDFTNDTGLTVECIELTERWENQRIVDYRTSIRVIL